MCGKTNGPYGPFVATHTHLACPRRGIDEAKRRQKVRGLIFFLGRLRETI